MDDMTDRKIWVPPHGGAMDQGDIDFLLHHLRQICQAEAYVELVIQIQAGKMINIKKTDNIKPPSARGKK